MPEPPWAQSILVKPSQQVEQSKSTLGQLFLPHIFFPFFLFLHCFVATQRGDNSTWGGSACRWSELPSVWIAGCEISSRGSTTSSLLFSFFPQFSFFFLICFNLASICHYLALPELVEGCRWQHGGQCTQRRKGKREGSKLLNYGWVGLLAVAGQLLPAAIGSKREGEGRN